MSVMSKIITASIKAFQNIVWCIKQGMNRNCCMQMLSLDNYNTVTLIQSWFQTVGLCYNNVSLTCRYAIYMPA